VAVEKGKVMRLNTSCAAVAIGLSFLAVGVRAGDGVPLVAVEFDTGDLYQVSPADASVSAIGSTGIAHLGSLEFNPHDGFFYAFTVEPDPGQADLYRIALSADASSVQSVSLVGSTGIFVSEGGIAFAPDGTAYAVNAGVTLGGLFTIDLQTGDATLIDLFDDRHDIAGLGWRDDGMLVGLDSTENELVLIDPSTATVQTLADVGPTIGRLGGLTLPGETGYFVTAGPDALTPGSNSLYAFSAATGDQTLVGSFETVIEGSGFSGLSIVPEPGVLTLLGLGCLSLLRRRT
jgi:hypothetical protein